MLMSSLLRSLAILGWFVFMGALVITKVGDLFPAIDDIGWTIMVAGFLIMTGTGVVLEPLIARLPLRWVNANEDRRIAVIIVALTLLVILALNLLWPVIGHFFAPHFGEMAH